MFIQLPWRGVNLSKGDGEVYHDLHQPFRLSLILSSQDGRINIPTNEDTTVRRSHKFRSSVVLLSSQSYCISININSFFPQTQTYKLKQMGGNWLVSLASILSGAWDTATQLTRTLCGHF